MQVKDSGFPYHFHAEGNTLVVVFDEKYASGFDRRTGEKNGRWMLVWIQIGIQMILLS